MGKGDNRRTLKMRRKVGQAKKKQRRAVLLASISSSSNAPRTNAGAVKKPSTRTTIKRARVASNEPSS